MKKYGGLFFVIIIATLIIGGYFLISPNFRQKSSSVISTIENTTSVATDQVLPISTVIVPHHDLMKDERATYLKTIKESPKTVILASPNHFDSGKGDIITTTKDWTVAGGAIMADKDKINQLLKSDLFSNEEVAFNGEHGIANILDDIHADFPSSKIIPIIIRQNTARGKITGLNTELNSVCGADCLLIASIDCSHYQPGSLAQIHDDMTKRALNNMDEDLAWKSEVDSPQSLLLSVLWAKSKSTTKFELNQNTNSGKLSGSRDTESTSYILGDFAKGDADTKVTDEFSFIFGGDMMYDRKVDYNFRGNDIYKIFDNFGDRTFWGTDLAFANLEGPISATPIPADNSGSMVFNFPPTVPNLLKWLHINSVSLANNHSDNAGLTGYTNTVKVLTDAGITPVGHQTGYDSKSIARYQSGDVHVSLIAIDELATNADITADIKTEKAKGARVIIFPHWGTEYQTIHNSSQELLAHRWIDAGADMVIGSHPHVVEDAEVYKNKPIFYSLGNFVFDQTFSTETQRGLIVAGEFKGNDIKLVLLPTKEVNIQPQLLTGTEKDSFIAKYRAYLGQPVQTGYGSDTITLSGK